MRLPARQRGGVRSPVRRPNRTSNTALSREISLVISSRRRSTWASDADRSSSPTLSVALSPAFAIAITRERPSRRHASIDGWSRRATASSRCRLHGVDRRAIRSRQSAADEGPPATRCIDGDDATGLVTGAESQAGSDGAIAGRASRGSCELSCAGEVERQNIEPPSERHGQRPLGSRKTGVHICSFPSRIGQARSVRHACVASLE
jgi:hypothetical protein